MPAVCGFSIRATRDLVAEEMLYPLIGLMASDSMAASASSQFTSWLLAAFSLVAR